MINKSNGIINQCSSHLAPLFMAMGKWVTRGRTWMHKIKTISRLINESVWTLILASISMLMDWFHFFPYIRFQRCLSVFCFLENSCWSCWLISSQPGACLRHFNQGICWVSFFNSLPCSGHSKIQKHQSTADEPFVRVRVDESLVFQHQTRQLEGDEDHTLGGWWN